VGPVGVINSNGEIQQYLKEVCDDLMVKSIYAWPNALDWCLFIKLHHNAICQGIEPLRPQGHPTPLVLLLASRHGTLLFVRLFSRKFEKLQFTGAFCGVSAAEYTGVQRVYTTPPGEAECGVSTQFL
jgi:hypothetical protein